MHHGLRLLNNKYHHWNMPCVSPLREESLSDTSKQYINFEVKRDPFMKIEHICKSLDKFFPHTLLLVCWMNLRWWLENAKKALIKWGNSYSLL